MLQKYKLKNGSGVILAPNSSTEAATILVIFGVGSRYERAQENGLSHYLEHLFFKGTKKRPSTFEIAKELDSLGASYNAFTSEEVTGYFVECEKKNFSKAIEIISDLLTNPLFKKEELEREKNVIIEEINMYEDLPQRYVLELAKLSMFGNTPLGRDVAGKKEIIKSFSRKNVLNYKESHYHANNMHIIISGNFSGKIIKDLISKNFSKIKKLKKSEFEKAKLVYNKPKVNLKFKKTDQAHLVLGFPGVAFDHPSRIPLALLSTILGGGMSSRLFIQVRERRGLGYYIRSESANFHDSGMFFAHAGIKISKISEAIKVILDEYIKIKQEKIIIEELKKAKNQARGKIAIELEKSQEMAMFLGEQSIYKEKIQDVKEFMQSIDKISLEDLKKVAKKFILPQYLNLAIIGPYKDKNKFEKIVNKFNR